MLRRAFQKENTPSKIGQDARETPGIGIDAGRAKKTRHGAICTALAASYAGSPKANAAMMCPASCTATSKAQVGGQGSLEKIRLLMAAMGAASTDGIIAAVVFWMCAVLQFFTLGETRPAGSDSAACRAHGSGGLPP
ncbi:MAG: hypothetical protein ACK4UX_11385 [Thiobacillus sp.]